jgi:hypothetical protein
VQAAANAAETEKTFARFIAMLRDDVRPRSGAISYECIAEIAAGHGEADLAKWIKQRIREGLAAH